MSKYYQTPGDYTGQGQLQDYENKLKKRNNLA